MMEVVSVIQPDDWLDESDVGHRIFGVFTSGSRPRPRFARQSMTPPRQTTSWKRSSPVRVREFEVDQRQADENE